MQRKEAQPQSLDEMADEAEAMEAAVAAAEAAEMAGEDAGPDVLATLVAERDAYKDRFMRALADAENTRKRAERDKREAEAYGATRLARDLLPVYDSLFRALEAIGEDQREAQAALVEGIELTLRELLAVFGRHGIKQIDPQIGDRFDPLVHQAMFEAPLPGTRAGEIIQVSADGFMLHERLLRPAQVGVSSTPAS